MWFHGSQSQSTGGSSARNGITLRIISWFEHSMRCVLITPFGRPVDPDVKRILAIVSGPTRACASSTAAVAGVRSISANGVAGNPSGADADTINSVPDGRTERRAASYEAPSAANTRAGLMRSKI